MPADQIRNRTVGCKMTDSEYERLSAVVQSEGMTLGEWCREVLLERAEGRKPSVIEETLLAEVLALRTILLNAFYKLAQGEKLTAEEMQAIIERADANKVQKAIERLAGRVARMSGSQGGAPHVGFTCGAFDFDLEFFGVRSPTSNSYDFLPFVNPQNRSGPTLPHPFHKIRNCSTSIHRDFLRAPVSPDWRACTRSSLESSSRYTR